MALARFFLETRDELHDFFMRRLHCPETAADLAQETYIRLHTSGERAIVENPRALAFHIAGNLAIDHVRKSKTRARFESPLPEEAEGLEWVPCQRPGPEQTLMGRQALERVAAALDELPGNQRDALYLSTTEGLSYAQIGERLGVSERTVAKYVANALKHCRDRRADG